MATSLGGLTSVLLDQQQRFTCAYSEPPPQCQTQRHLAPGGKTACTGSVGASRHHFFSTGLAFSSALNKHGSTSASQWLHGAMRDSERKQTPSRVIWFKVTEPGQGRGGLNRAARPLGPVCQQLTSKAPRSPLSLRSVPIPSMRGGVAALWEPARASCSSWLQVLLPGWHQASWASSERLLEPRLLWLIPRSSFQDAASLLQLAHSRDAQRFRQ